MDWKQIKEFYRKIKGKVPDPLLKYKNFLKFAIVGGSGTVINMLFLWLFHDKLNMALALAGILAIELSILNNFIWNQLWTFRKSTNKSNLFMRFGKYHLSVLLGIAINYGVLLIITKQFGVDYRISNLIGILCATLSNYVLSSKWAWKNE